MTLQELLQKYGQGAFGGSLGLTKTAANPRSTLFDQGYGDLNDTDLYGDSYNPFLQKEIDAFSKSLGREAGYDELQPVRDSVAKKFDHLKDVIQVSPELYQNTLRHNQTPEGFQGTWINNLDSVKYSPEYGLYLNRNDYGNGKFGLDNAGAPQGNFFAQTFSDPQFTLPLAYAGAVASGIGAASSAAGGASAPAAAGGFAPGSLDALAAGANYGGISAIPGTAATGGFNVGAAGFGGLDFLGAAGAAGAGGNMSWWDDIANSFSDADLSYFDNFEFPSNFDVTPSGGGSFLDGFDPEYANISGGVDGPINSFGGASTDWGDILSFAKETGNYSSLLDKVKSSYDQYGKPIKTGYNTLDALLSGGSSASSGGLSKLLGSLGSAALGAYASNSQANATQALADKYAGYGEPYRKRLADLYTNPDSFLTSNEVQKPVQQGTNILARSLSTQGNPVASGNALQQLQSYSADQLFGKLGQEKDRLAGFGGLTNYNAAVPGLDTAAIGQKSNVFNAVGSGISNIFNPQESLADILKRSGY